MEIATPAMRARNGLKEGRRVDFDAPAEEFDAADEGGGVRTAEKDLPAILAIEAGVETRYGSDHLSGGASAALQ